MKTDDNCIFCKIVAGKIPSTKVYEDDDSLAFMDIGPVSPGHVLLICKEHYEKIHEVPAEVAAKTLAVLPKLVNAVQTATGCAGLNVLQNNGRIAGQLVPHVHFHIIPRYGAAGEFRFDWPAGKYQDGKMQEFADKIKSHLSGK
ncbi:MAG TPA: HIT family protein [Phycisphaerae bacterium]|nr:HIT family protein [Phycisphaerae bacterium]